MCVGRRDPIGLRGRGSLMSLSVTFIILKKFEKFHLCFSSFVCLCFELHSSKKKNNKFPTISFRTSRQSEAEAEMWKKSFILVKMNLPVSWRLHSNNSTNGLLMISSNGKRQHRKDILSEKVTKLFFNSIYNVTLQKFDLNKI